LHTFDVSKLKYTNMRASIASCFLILAALNLAAQSSTVRWEYIQRYKEIAMGEMKRTGIPASIKLAQGILESNAGASTLARKANNHFGMKCGSEWRGPTYYIKDDDYDENGQLIESCFRVYEDAESSYIAHSEFLRDPNKAYRYGFLFRLDQKDYKKWAQGLKQSGYATSPSYADALISLIDQYKLYNFDTGNSSFDEIRFINDVEMTLAKMGQTPEELASKYNLKTRCILKYNEGLSGAKQPLAEGQYIYLQRKRWFFRGKQQYHFVKEGETMYSIAQQYGLKLNWLYCKNRMSKGEEPAVNQKVRLRGRVRRGQSPKLREVQPLENDNTIPLDNGTGKILDMDPTNVVKPGDLPNSSSSSNSSTNSNSNPNSSTNSNTGTNSNSSTNTGAGAKPSTNSNSNTGTNSNSSTNTGAGAKSSTNSNSNPSTNSNTGTNSNSSTNTGAGAKPSTNSNSNPSTNSNTGTNSNSNSTTSGTKPTTTPSNTTTTPSGTKPATTTETKPSTTPSTTGGTTNKPSTTTIPTKPKPEPTGGIKPAPTTPSTTATTHTVNAGETLYAISKLYNVKVDQIKTLNELKDNNIKPGQVLKIKE
jgi:LysM repeat protein